MTNRTNEEERLLEKSFKWISKNPNALNTEVPEDLLEAWISDDPECKLPDNSNGIEWSVFLYIISSKALNGSSEAKLQI
jgi:hypothetical protein